MKAQTIFLAAILSIFFIACSKEDDSTPNVLPTPDPGTINSLTDAITSGTWKVSYFWDTDHDETNHLKDYTFNFSKSGSCTAKLLSNTYFGMWHTSLNDNQLKLKLTFPTPAELAKISDDWHVIETKETKIRMDDVSGGNGGTDLLTLTKM